MFVAQSKSRSRREHMAHHSATQAANAEAGRFLGGKDNKLDGPAGTKPGALQGANRFEAPQHADRAVVGAGVGNRIDVRAGSDWSQFRRATSPSSKGVADGVFPYFKPGFRSEALYIGAGAQIRLTEYDARHHGRFGF